MLKIPFGRHFLVGRATLKVLKIMKLTTIFLLAFTLQLSAKAHSQKVSLHVQNMPLEKVLNQIKSQTGYAFIYTTSMLKKFEDVTLDLDQVDLKQVLNVCLKDQPFTYTIIDKAIILRAKQLNEKTASAEQPRLIHGIVVDKDKLPLAGTSIKIEGTQAGTVTDGEGRFSLSVPNGAEAVLEVSRVGYQTKTIKVGDLRQFTIELLESVEQLNDIVVVGYGTQKKEDLTGSISSIVEADLKKTALTSPDQALQGRVAGVQVTQNSSAPGGGTTIRIRGGNSIQGGNEPLYVIDGVPVYSDDANSGASLNGLSSIDPHDIASMEILKDASATAIYGSRGANGVVIITTKRGKAGHSDYNLGVYYGTQKVRRKYPLLNGTEFAQLVNEANTNEGNAPVYSDEEIAQIGKGTDWQDEIFREAPISNYYLSASGGDEKTQYAISGNYFKQEGVVLNSDFDRASFRLNLDRKMSSKFKIGNTLTLSHSKSNRARTDGSLNASGQVIANALLIFPTIPVYQPDGSFTLQTALGQLTDNPLALAVDSKNDVLVNRVLGSLYGEYSLSPALKLKVLFGVDGIFQKSGSYLPKSVLSGFQQGGLASITNVSDLTWLNENTLTYDKTFNEKHQLTVLAGYTQQASRSERNYTAARGFINDNLGYNNLGAGEVPLTPSSSVGTWGLISYLGRINYKYDNRFLFTLTGRIDGSSRFGENNRYGYFPSGAFAWRLIEEPFIKNLNIFSDLKLRTSYGLTGNQEGIGNYPSQSLLSVQNYVFGGAIQSGVGPSQIANPDLKWESTAQTDIGLDLGFFKNRISIVADAYIKRTKDLLLNIIIPGTSGYTGALKNIGEVENKGIELGINTRNIEGNFSWNTALNFAANKNTVLDIGGVSQILSGQTANIGQNVSSGIIRVGEPLGVFYGYVTDGLFQQGDDIEHSAQPTARPGDRKYKDLNGDNVIDDNDREIIGRAQPKWFGGVTNNFSYKGFELSVFFQGVYGNDILNANRFELEYLSGTTNQDKDMLDRWTPTHTNTDIPRASVNRPANRISTRQVEDASYLRLKNIRLAYNFSNSLLSKWKIKSLQLYASAQNLVTWTDYSGYDPEVNRFGQDNLSQGFDYGSYPSAKTFLFGLNVTF